MPVLPHNPVGVYDEPNMRMGSKHLGEHRPASTVICCQLLDPAWKLEIEAGAAT